MMHPVVPVAEPIRSIETPGGFVVVDAHTHMRQMSLGGDWTSFVYEREHGIAVWLEPVRRRPFEGHVIARGMPDMTVVIEDFKTKEPLGAFWGVELLAFTPLESMDQFHVELLRSLRSKQPLN